MKWALKAPLGVFSIVALTLAAVPGSSAQTTYSDATVCSRALSSERSGWVKDSFFSDEASRRGLTVDACRQASPAPTFDAPASTDNETSNQRSNAQSAPSVIKPSTPKEPSMSTGTDMFKGTLIFGLALLYAPWIVAMVAGPAGGGTWKFLAFVMSTLSVIGVFFFFIPGMIAWLIGLACAAAAHTSAASARSSRRMLAALEKQNLILRRSVPDSLETARSGPPIARDDLVERDEAQRLLFTPRDTRNMILMILIVGGLIAVYVNS